MLPSSQKSAGGTL